jgi:hypothetical protein
METGQLSSGTAELPVRTLSQLAATCEEGRATLDRLADDERILFHVLDQEGYVLLFSVDGAFAKRNANIFSCLLEPLAPVNEKMNFVEIKLVRKALLGITTYSYDPKSNRGSYFKEGATSIESDNDISCEDLRKGKIVKMIHFFM